MNARFIWPREARAEIEAAAATSAERRNPPRRPAAGRAPAWLAAVERAIRVCESSPSRGDAAGELAGAFRVEGERWLAKDKAFARVFSAAARRGLGGVLEHRLRRALAGPLEEEWAAACSVVGREPSRAGWGRALREDGLREWLRAHPPLARLAGTLAVHWRGACRRLARAARALRGRNARVRRITGPWSDFHGGGHCVLRCTFAGSETWYFKPRSLEVDAAWNALVAALQAQGARWLRASPPVVKTRHGGWQPEIVGRPPTTLAKARTACRSVGALLAAAHWLRATDLHADNVCLGGDGAVLLDAETLLHPLPPVPARMEQADGGVFAWEESVLRTHAFACELKAGAGPPAARAGWFGARPGEPHAEFWRAVRGRLPGAAWRDAVTAGFRATMDACVRHAPVLAGGVARLARAERRLLWRDTASFAAILDAALTRAASRDGRARSLVFEAFARHRDLPPLTPAEIYQLETGDIPRAVTRDEAPPVLGAAAARRAVDEVAALLRRGAPVRLRRV